MNKQYQHKLITQVMESYEKDGIHDLTLEDAIDILEYHNRWRRGAEIEQQNTTQTGIAIDVLLKRVSTINDIISEVEAEYPYKEHGNRGSYSKYNEGWSDACDIIRGIFNGGNAKNNK